MVKGAMNNKGMMQADVSVTLPMTSDIVDSTKTACRVGPLMPNADLLQDLYENEWGKICQQTWDHSVDVSTVHDTNDPASFATE